MFYHFENETNFVRSFLRGHIDKNIDAKKVSQTLFLLAIRGQALKSSIVPSRSNEME